MNLAWWTDVNVGQWSCSTVESVNGNAMVNFLAEAGGVSVSGAHYRLHLRLSMVRDRSEGR